MACRYPADESRLDTATFLDQHTALLRDWPGEGVHKNFATSAKLRPILHALPPEHKLFYNFLSVTGARTNAILGTPQEATLI